MRYLADEILGLKPLTEPHEHFAVFRPEDVKLDLEEDHSKETAISRAVAILCDCAADGADVRSLLTRTRILTPCRILADRESSSTTEHAQIARLIAILAQEGDDLRSFVEWLPWLRIHQTSENLFLSGNALRGVIHIQRRQSLEPAMLPSFPDGIYFFNPRPSLSDSLAQTGAMKDDTAVDAVFIHGIRGGPFLTWRSEATSESQSSRGSCWPSQWLPADLPQARLLTVHFPAPVSSWEGGSNSLKHTASMLLKNLIESGIGQRPVIFVGHSMGGIIVKEMLLQSLAIDSQKGVADQTCGIVFVSTPHSGAWSAHIAWGLRYFGACPAPSLNAMKPGPYLRQLNADMHRWVRERELPVISFAETLWTDISPMIPRFYVVPPSSAFPGYGEAILLHGYDHVNSCKPKERSSLFYRQTLRFLRKQIDDVTSSHSGF